MKIYCVANLDNKQQIENLCLCLGIVGANPIVDKSSVTVEYEGHKEKCDLIIQIFEHYPRHGIYSESPTAPLK